MKITITLRSCAPANVPRLDYSLAFASALPAEGSA